MYYGDISGPITEASTQGTKRLKQSDPDDVKYPCNECSYVASYIWNLKQHKESRHNGVKYPCEKCEYAATRKSSLKRHMRLIHHEEAEYSMVVELEPHIELLAGELIVVPTFTDIHEIELFSSNVLLHPIELSLD